MTGSCRWSHKRDDDVKIFYSDDTVRSRMLSPDPLAPVDVPTRVIPDRWCIVYPAIYKCDVLPEFENLLPRHEPTETNGFIR